MVNGTKGGKPTGKIGDIQLFIKTSPLLNDAGTVRYFRAVRAKALHRDVCLASAIGGWGLNHRT
jgi:hypothetical protein